MHNFGPFSVKIYTHTQFGGVRGGSAPVPKKNFVFCEINMHNFRPFLV